MIKTNNICKINSFQGDEQVQRRGPGVLRAGVRRDPPCHAQFAAKISNSEAHFGVRFGPAGRIQETKPGEDLFFSLNIL